MPQSRASSSSSAKRTKPPAARRPARRPPASKRTKLLGSETPRLFTKPRRKLTAKTTAGYEAIKFAEDVLDITLLPWQRWLLLHMLELNPDGTFRFRTVVILVARQNGKTLLMQVLSLWRMYVDGVALVIGTAQNLDVAEEAWQKTVEFAESVPDLAAEIKHVDRTNGKKALRLQTGERYKVAASSRRGGRGLSGDLVLLDELREHRDWKAWSAISKTTLARAKAQIVGTSNAGDHESVVLHQLRSRALEAINRRDTSTSVGLFEWSAPDDAAPDDRRYWPMANPSLGYPDMITEEAIANALETDPDDEFTTEVLCQWSDKVTIPTISPEDWAACEDDTSVIVGPVSIAADTNPQRTRSTVAVAGLNVAGRWHVEIIQRDAGTDWLVDAIVGYCERNEAKPWLDPAVSGPLITKLIKRGIDVETVTGRDYVQACGEIVDAVTGLNVADDPDDEVHRQLVHIGQDALEDALLDAGTKSVGEAWKWTHRGAEGDITPLIAVTLALHGAMQTEGADYDVLDSVL